MRARGEFPHKCYRHLQKALDRRFPGVRLAWCPNVREWVLMDRPYSEEGIPVRGRWMRPTQSTFNAIGDQPTQYGVMFRLVRKGEEPGMPDTPFPPFRDLILAGLQRAFTGAKKQQIFKQVDIIEAAELAAEVDTESEMRDAQRETARVAFDRSRGKVRTGGGVGSEHYTDNRKVSRAIQKQMREDARRDAEIDAAVMEQVRDGRCYVNYAGSMWDESAG